MNVIEPLNTLDHDDPLNSALDLMRITTSLYCRGEMTAPWGIQMYAMDHIAAHLVLNGACWLTTNGVAEPVRLDRGDLAIILSGQDHELRDELTSDATELGHILATRNSPHSKAHFGGGGPTTELLCSAFAVENPDALPILLSLPAVLHIAGINGQPAAWLQPILDRLKVEMLSDMPGAANTVGRLSELLMTLAVRHVMHQQGVQEVATLARLTDPKLPLRFARCTLSPRAGGQMPAWRDL